MSEPGITYEKGLRDIIRTYVQSTTKARIRPVFDITLAICLLATFLLWMLDVETEKLQQPIKEVSGVLVSIGAAALGMGVAGFAIIAASLDSKIIKVLSKVLYPKDMPALNYIFSLFVFALLVSLGSIALGLLFYILPIKGAMLGALLENEDGSMPGWTSVVVLVYGNVLIAWSALLIAAMKSFIVNIHQSMIFIASIKVADISLEEADHTSGRR